MYPLDASRIWALCGLVREAAGRGRKARTVTFFTLNEWAAAFSPAEDSALVLGGYLAWYAQYHYLLRLMRARGEVVPVTVTGQPIRGVLLEELPPFGRPTPGEVLVASVAPLVGWSVPSEVSFLGDPLCVAAAVHSPEGRVFFGAVAWDAGTAGFEEGAAAVEAWAREKGAAQCCTVVDQNGRIMPLDLCDSGCNLVRHPVAADAPFWERALGEEVVRPEKKVVVLEEARRRLARKVVPGR
jgi:hypothetical protein